ALCTSRCVLRHRVSYPTTQLTTLERLVRRTKLAVATGAAALLALTACAGDPDAVDGEGDGGGGGTLNMQIGQVVSLVPGGSGESEGFRIIKNVYEGLVYYDAETGDPENMVAEEITSEDNQ